jgi:hypothetical protein
MRIQDFSIDDSFGAYAKYEQQLQQNVQQKMQELSVEQLDEEAFLDCLPHLREIEQLTAQWKAYCSEVAEKNKQWNPVYPTAPFDRKILMRLKKQNPYSVWVLIVRRQSKYLSEYPLRLMAQECYYNHILKKTVDLPLVIRHYDTPTNHYLWEHGLTWYNVRW